MLEAYFLHDILAWNYDLAVWVFLMLEGALGVHTGCLCHRLLKSAQLTFEIKVNAIKALGVPIHSVMSAWDLFSSAVSVYVCMLLEAVVGWGC